MGTLNWTVRRRDYSGDALAKRTQIITHRTSSTRGSRLAATEKEKRGTDAKSLSKAFEFDLTKYYSGNENGHGSLHEVLIVVCGVKGILQCFLVRPE